MNDCDNDKARITPPTAARRRALGAAARASAYTLIEVLVVVAIISILAVVAGVSWQRLRGSQIEGQAIDTFVRFAAVARTHAMQTDTTVAIVFDDQGRIETYIHQALPDPSVPTNVDANRFVPLGLLSETALPEEDLRLACIDYAEAATRRYDTFAGEEYYFPVGSHNSIRDIDRVSRVAVCFDGDGHLITRLLKLELPKDYHHPNRNQYNPGLTELYSTRGCVAYKWSVLTMQFGSDPDPSQGKIRTFLDQQPAVALNQWSGQLVGGNN
ncbi:MAG TPA: type II secretion system protein [Phycisphaerae bacterium]|nr:type II secretion system protein [Phycisphaerae bacterium]